MNDEEAGNECQEEDELLYNNNKDKRMNGEGEGEAVGEKMKFVVESCAGRHAAQSSGQVCSFGLGLLNCALALWTNQIRALSGTIPLRDSKAFHVAACPEKPRLNRPSQKH